MPERGRELFCASLEELLLINSMFCSAGSRWSKTVGFAGTE